MRMMLILVKVQEVAGVMATTKDNVLACGVVAEGAKHFYIHTGLAKQSERREKQYL